MPFIVAMSVQGEKIRWFIILMISIQMIDFNHIAVTEEQFTPSTLPLLFLKEPCELPSQQVL